MKEHEKYGYLRYKEGRTDVTHEYELFIKHGVTRLHIFMDDARSFVAPNLTELNGVLRPGDTLFVKSILDLSNDAEGLFALMEQYANNDIRVISLEELEIDPHATGDAPIKTRLLNAAISLIWETYHGTGINPKREKRPYRKPTGEKQCGRPKKANPMLEDAIKMYYQKPDLTVNEICKRTGVNIRTLYREIARRKEREQATGETETKE